MCGRACGRAAAGAAGPVHQRLGNAATASASAPAAHPGRSCLGWPWPPQLRYPNSAPKPTQSSVGGGGRARAAQIRLPPVGSQRLSWIGGGALLPAAARAVCSRSRPARLGLVHALVERAAQSQPQPPSLPLSPLFPVAATARTADQERCRFLCTPGQWSSTSRTMARRSL